MKAVVRSFVAIASFLTATTVLADPSFLQSAQDYYNSRDYNAAGIANAEKAAELYGQMVKQATDEKERAQLAVRQAEALYFVGAAVEDKETKKKFHAAGMTASELTLHHFGIEKVTSVSKEKVASLKASLSAEDMLMLVEGIYQWGINLGQWGAANGVSESLSRWPELRASMQLVIDLGHRSLNQYGPFRVLGRGYHKIPEILGGSMSKADKYYATAIKETLAEGTNISINGFNTLYYAELLKDAKKASVAKDLLNAFLAVDATTLNPNYIPENLEAQRLAKELLKSL